MKYKIGDIVKSINKNEYYKITCISKKKFGVEPLDLIGYEYACDRRDVKLSSIGEYETHKVLDE